MSKRYSRLDMLLVFIFISFIVLSLLLFGISVLPFSIVKTHVDGLSKDGQIQIFNLAFFEKLVLKIRVVSVFILIIALLGVVLRKFILNYLNKLINSFARSFSVSKVLFLKWIRAEQQIHLYALAIIVIWAIIIRICYLFQPMRYDEAHTFITYASRPLYVGLSFYSEPNNHLFHTVLVHISYLLFGHAAWALRLPAFLAGVLLVPVAYLTTRIIYNKYAAILAAGLIASSSELILYSTNARGYSIITLLFLGLILLGTILIRSNKTSAWFIFTILSAIGFYTIPTMLYPFGIVIVWIGLSYIIPFKSLNQLLKLNYLLGSLVFVIVTTAILYAPVLLSSGIDSIINNRFVQSNSWDYFTSHIFSSLQLVWKEWNQALPIVIGVVLVISFFVTILFHSRLSQYPIPMLLAVILWVVPVLAFQKVIPFTRIWIFLLPLYFITAASGVYFIFKMISIYKPVNNLNFISVTLALIFSFWMGYSVFNSNSVYYADGGGRMLDAEAVTLFFKEHLRENDKVIAVPPVDGPIEYYFYINKLPLAYINTKAESAKRIFVVQDINQGHTLQEILEKRKLDHLSFTTPKVVKKYKGAIISEILPVIP